MRPGKSIDPCRVPTPVLCKLEVRAHGSPCLCKSFSTGTHKYHVVQRCYYPETYPVNAVYISGHYLCYPAFVKFKVCHCVSFSPRAMRLQDDSSPSSRNDTSLRGFPLDTRVRSPPPYESVDQSHALYKSHDRSFAGVRERGAFAWRCCRTSFLPTWVISLWESQGRRSFFDFGVRAYLLHTFAVPNFCYSAVYDRFCSW